MIIVSLFIAHSSLRVQQRERCRIGYAAEVFDMMGFGYGSGWIYMFIGGLLIVGLIVLIVFLLVRATSVAGKSGYNAPPDAEHADTRHALAILAERYAKGEISDEEYQHRKSEITRS